MTTIDIILITYNQSQYVQQALDGIMIQKFQDKVSIRIIVADDCSTDGTIDIIKSYESIIPYSFIYLPGEKNMGHVKNYKRAFDASSADYIAIIEGDDWWCSPNHLQSRLDYMQEHLECALCSMFPYFYDETERKFEVWNLSDNVTSPTWQITIDEEIAENKIVNLSSCMFRSKFIHQLPNKLFEINTILDWPMYICLAELGLLCILEGSTSVYRVLDNGIWSGNKCSEQDELSLEMLSTAEKILEGRHKKAFSVARKFLTKNSVSKSRNRKIIEFLLKPFVCVEKNLLKVKKIYKSM
ncbi:MAG: glycosyltransferase [Paludibacteraceae bacterium]|nr:glycosyltransferase [Paludibacteraceae bacterium]